MKVIGFVGVDGCGKSSVVNSIKIDFEVEKFAHVHFRPGLLTYRTSGVNHITDAQVNLSKRGALLSEILVCYYLVDSLLALTYYYFQRKEVILWERPLIDVLVFPERYRLSKVVFSKSLVLLLMRFVNVVHLTGDPSLIFSRKQELSIDAIAEYDKRYKQSRPNLSVNVSLSIIEIKTIIYESFGIGTL